MKKFYILIFALFSLLSFSQKDYSRYYNSWRLGLNLGGAWQTADYRSCYGMGGGFTLEKGLHENSTNFFSFAIRGRYLAANTYGMDYNRNYYVKSNDAYNGKYDPAVNFVDSVPLNRQYVFDNYKMTLGEGALELQLTFNRLRERTHVLLNLWGGVGVTSYRTKSDLLDADKKMYNFSLVDSTGNETKALNSYNGLIDKNYESYAYGSRNGNLVTFSPSAGIGLGYQFSPGFSILWEYKITLPQGTNADLLDGKVRLNNDKIGGNNDYYHYTALNLLFTLRGKKKSKSTAPKDETVYTNTTVPTQSTTVPASSVAPTSTLTSLPPKGPKPVVSFITPPTNGMVVNNQKYKISAQVLNVSASNKIQFKFNGVAYNDFTFNTKTNLLEYNASLINGSNSVMITASNTAGSDTKQTSVVYEQPRPGGNPPLVSYLNPVQAGTTVAVKTFTVLAQVLNVTTQKNISVYFNGISTPFTYNSSSKQISFPAVLNEGSNNISITANNTLGEDTKATQIIFKKETPVLPVVNLINPSNTMNNVNNSLYNFKLGVLNVNSKSDIEVVFNGNLQSAFTYDPVSRELVFQTNLSSGNNNLSVKGTNSFGSDSKQITVVYRQPVELKSPPFITINNPSSDGNITTDPAHTFKATVTNVPNTTGLKVKFNGNIVTNFTYDGFNLTYPAVLVQGNNQFEIKAVNNDGTDNKKRTLNFRVVSGPLPPAVNLKNPSSVESATENSVYNFKLAVLNVNSKSDIQVLFNGNPQSNFTYDTNTKEVNFQSNLVQGENTVLVKGTNNVGTDFKQIKVTYTPRTEIKFAAPSIAFINPGRGTPTSQSDNFVYKASIKGIPNANGLAVKYNGAPVSDFIYDGTILTYSAALVPGNNTLQIATVNNDGNEQKTATVIYSPVEAAKPIVTIVKPVNTPLVTSSVYNFKFNVLNATKPQIEVKLNGTSITNFNFTGTIGSFTSTLVSGNNILKVKATNAAGTDAKTESVIYRVDAPPAGTGATDEKKITICHIPPGNNQNPQTISIPASAWPAHLAHGDTQGACPSKKDTIKVKTPGKIINNSERGNGTPTVDPNTAPRKPR